jgi:anti-sigma regulatory factor (Ser/Thr protein kinase)
VTSATVRTTRFTHAYHGRADEVSRARRELARHLTACGFPRTDDAALVLSELCSNAVRHSASAGGFFMVRAEVHAGYAWVEVEDDGGAWHCRPPADRMHGLGIVEALTGPDGWGVDDTTDGTRVVWARLEWQ